MNENSALEINGRCTDRTCPPLGVREGVSNVTGDVPLAVGRGYKKLPPSEVVQLYLDGWSSNAIAEKFHATPTSVLSCLKNNGVKSRTVSATVALGVKRGRLEEVTRRRLRFNEFSVDGDVATLIATSKDGRTYQILIDADDLPRLQEHGRRWYVVRRQYTSYARAIRNGKMMYLHHFLLGNFLFRSIVIDHKNCNGLDNRRSNLRVVSQDINMLNRRGPRRGNKSGLRGVCWSKQMNKWCARIFLDGKSRNFGFFENKEEAAKVVQAKLVELGVLNAS